MPTKSLIKKTRKPRNPFREKVERELTHVNQDQALARHIYCIPPYHCDHPQDGWCRVGDYPTPLQLEEINHRLNPKGAINEATRDEAATKNQEVNKLAENRSNRTRKNSSEIKANPVKSYFCMKCEDWHNEPHEIYTEHFEFKRKRGQRLKSQLKPKA